MSSDSRSSAAPRLLITVDVEEFDLPCEHGQDLPLDEQLRVSAAGMERLEALFARHNVRATLFTTVVFAQAHPEMIRRLAQRHEIASHGWFHSKFEDAHLLRSRIELERISGTPVRAFRRARLAYTDPVAIAAAGYICNASFNPIWLPGRYNHFGEPRLPHWAAGNTEPRVLNLPASCSPLLRVPLFWLALKNFPMWLIRSASKRVIDQDGVLCTYIHPWEFSPLAGFTMPWTARRIDGDRMLARMEEYLVWLKTRGEFVTCSELVRERAAARTSAL